MYNQQTDDTNERICRKDNKYKITAWNARHDNVCASKTFEFRLIMFINYYKCMHTENYGYVAKFNYVVGVKLCDNTFIDLRRDKKLVRCELSSIAIVTKFVEKNKIMRIYLVTTENALLVFNTM